MEPTSPDPTPRPDQLSGPAQPGSGFVLDVADALNPDPTNQDMFVVRDNCFAFSPGHLCKLLNPKSLSAFYALGGLAGLERGLRTSRDSGLSIDETALDGTGANHNTVQPDPHQRSPQFNQVNSHSET